MKIEISYSEGKTIQEVQFEPRTFHISAKVEIESKEYDDEEIHRAYLELKKSVKQELKSEVESIRGKDITKDNSVPF